MTQHKNLISIFSKTARGLGQLIMINAMVNATIKNGDSNSAMDYQWITSTMI